MGCFGSNRNRADQGMAAPPAPTAFTPPPPQGAPEPTITPGFGQSPNLKGLNPMINSAAEDTLFADPERGIWVGYLPEKKPRVRSPWEVAVPVPRRY